MNEINFVKMSAADVEEAIEPISWLAGRWITKEGKGMFGIFGIPNVKLVGYYEELEFSFMGQPMLNYTSVSIHPLSQSPLHQERGFLIINPGTNDLAFVVSNNIGLTSLEEGRCDTDNKEIILESETVNTTKIPTSMLHPMKKFMRILKLLDENTMEVTLFAETDNIPLAEHMRAVYTRIEEFSPFKNRCPKLEMADYLHQSKQLNATNETET